MASLHHLLPPGVTVKVAAETLDVAPEYLSDILNLKREPGWRLAMAINRHFPMIEKWMLKPDLWQEGE